MIRSKEIKTQLLDYIRWGIEDCDKCDLCGEHKNAVPGEGHVHATLMFVGEGPGAEEDRTGRPFVGRAGKLLDNMIASMEMKREDVFIANIVKHRPPNNRKPEPEEMQACIPFLYQQIYVIRPKIIVALGATATEGLLGPGPGITKRRGQWGELKLIEREPGCPMEHSIPVMPTFHPSALLRRKEWKTDAWHDLQKVKKVLDSGLTPKQLSASEAYAAKCESVGW
jgi:uracil-DNA glycosylase family 4